MRFATPHGLASLFIQIVVSQNKFEREIWFKYKACSLDSSGGVLLYVEHWVRLCNAVIGAKNRSNEAIYFSFADPLCYFMQFFDTGG